MRRRFFSLRQSLTFVVIAAVLVALVIGTQTPQNRSLQGVAAVSDGDSIRLGGQRVRLIGIDAPELAQTCAKGQENWACGQDAKASLQSKIDQQRIVCVGDRRDQFRRLLAVCYLGREDINAWLVREGWAVSYNDYTIDEVLARRDRRGIWASDFEVPHKWRARHGASESGILSWLWSYWPF
ncbi:thermonuclease family protein [Maritalea mediterranea]|uniref:Thermonuclease family protein n=1 Tax=Maritalea mediterranea TaxID=2909667 RepID=A0ABS9E5A0_9HYPH|nr:thermonuclease family protein [Maritalea mediterranea]MCF4098021.1 thermonuclease family protein [Maritalea mediterranea]